MNASGVPRPIEKEAKMRMKTSVLSGLLLMALAAPASAAAVNFNFATTGSPLFGAAVTGSGVFDLSNTSEMINGYTAFQIDSITGTVNGSSIVAPTGNYGAYYVTGPSFLDGAGANFLTAGGTSVSFFYEDAVSEYRVNTMGPFSTSFVTASATAVSPAAVPEPASWSLLLAGMALIGGTVLRKKAGTLAAKTA